MAEEQRRKWHINREVSVGDVLAYIFAGTAILLSYGKLDTRVAILENSVPAQALRDQMQDDTLRAFTQEVRQQLMRIEDKLDRLKEKVNGRTRSPPY